MIPGTSLDIDDQSVTGRTIDDYTAFGELNGRFESSAKLRFTGRAKALWKNGGRVNPTKWERLSWEPRTAIIAAILALLGPLAGYIVMQIRKNSNIDWRFKTLKADSGVPS
jgi:hypothetical protein